jgi:hypothetical protein
MSSASEQLLYGIRHTWKGRILIRPQTLQKNVLI